MPVIDFAAQLDELAVAWDDDDILDRTQALTEAWSAAGAGIEAVEPVLRFMERHPSLDLGSPGPLVHFVERFYGPAYVQLLVASVERRPTPNTARMLNRVINGTRTPAARLELIEIMLRAARHPDADAATVDTLTGFLAHQKKAGR